MIAWQLVALSISQNCLHDYLLSREDSCYFGSDSSRVSLLADVEALIEGCDLKTCKCNSENLALKNSTETPCAAFSMQAMLQFMPIHGEPDDATADIYKNMTTFIKNSCVSGNIMENEPANNEIKFSFGACGPTKLPGSGHNAGIIAYVSVISALATFVYLYSDQQFVAPVAAKIVRSFPSRNAYI